MSDTTFTHPNDYPVLPRQYRLIERRGRTLVAAMMPYPTLDSGAKCIGDPAYSEELTRAPAGQIAYMKAKCAGCPLVTACAEWGIAHEREFIYGGLTPSERTAIRKERGQVVVEPSAAHQYGMNDEYVQNRGRQWKGEGNPSYRDGSRMAGPDINADGYAADMEWVHPLG